MWTGTPDSRPRLRKSWRRSASAERADRERKAGVPGLEPRLAEPESAGLPITPYPIGPQVPTAAG